MNKLICAFMFLIVASIGTIKAQAPVDSTVVKKVRWRNSAQVGLMFDNNSGLTGRISTQFYSGIRLGKFSTGLGVGINHYEDFFTVPLFLIAEYNLLKGAHSPVVYAKGGYAAPVFKEQLEGSASYVGGLNYGFGVGYAYSISSKIGVFVKIGYEFQQITVTPGVSYYYPGWWGYDSSFAPTGQTMEQIRKMGRVSFSFGFNF